VVFRHTVTDAGWEGVRGCAG